MTTYLLNSAVLTAFGRYDYQPVSKERARKILAEGFVSAIGHPGSAEFCSQILKLDVPLNRIAVQMQPLDQAIVIRLTTRLAEGQILSASESRSLPYEIGWLVCFEAANQEELPC